MDGYICLYRKMLDSELWQNHDSTRLFICLLLMANTVEGWEYMGCNLHAGQLIASLDKLARKCNLSRKKIRTGLERLKSEQIIQVEQWSKNKASLITIVNFKLYQFEDDCTRNGTPSGTRNGTRKKSATQSATNDYTNEAEESGTRNGTPSGTPMGTRATLSPNKGTRNGTPSGTRNGTRKKSATQSATNDYTSEAEESGTRNGTPMGTPMGNIQYSIYNIQDNILDINNNNSVKNQPTLSSANLEQMFEDFRRAYKGTKRGFKPEFENFKKKHPNWRDIVPLLMPALERMEAWRAQMIAKGAFVPQYAMLQTWLNQDRWTSEYDTTESVTTKTSNNGTSNTTAGTATDEQYIPNYDEEF